MSGYQVLISYAVSWWIVLFMVLPHKADAPAQPGLGHVPSAPENPQIRKKLWWTTWLAIIPTVALYLVIVYSAQAQEDMYRAKGCKPVAAETRASVAAVDGVGASGKQVRAATMNQNTILSTKQIDVPLAIPTEGYLSGARNVDLSETHAKMGQLGITDKGDALLNGQPIVRKEEPLPNCEE